MRKTGRMATDISFAIEKTLDNRDHMLKCVIRPQYVALYFCKSKYEISENDVIRKKVIAGDDGSADELGGSE